MTGAATIRSRTGHGRGGNGSSHSGYPFCLAWRRVLLLLLTAHV